MFLLGYVQMRVQKSCVKTPNSERVGLVGSRIDGAKAGCGRHSSATQTSRAAATFRMSSYKPAGPRTPRLSVL